VSYIAAALATIGVGLLVQGRGAALDPVARDVLGDVLWAAMMTWWIGAAAPSASLRARSATAYAVCVVVEASQLCHAPSLEALRATRVGQLVLGSGFDPRDLLAYALGVCVASLLEAALRAYR
jgi:hypothetical protein